MKLAGYVTCIRQERNEYRVLAGKPEGKDYGEELDIGRNIILTWILD
jgi:hypothetical protein